MAQTGWKQVREEFRERAYNVPNLRPLESRYAKTKHAYLLEGQPSKKPRQVCREPVQWSLPDNYIRLEIPGDSKLVIDWLNGIWKCQREITTDAWSP